MACGAQMGAEHTRHHEETEQAQRVFLEKVEKFSKAMQDLGDPFQEDNQDLCTLDTNDIAHQTAAELISTHLKKGKVYFEEFIKRRAHWKNLSSMSQSRKTELIFSDRYRCLLNHLSKMFSRQTVTYFQSCLYRARAVSDLRVLPSRTPITFHSPQ